jgi:hypothetical protein
MLSAGRVREVERRRGLHVFEECFGHAIADGRLDPAEVARLGAIAAGMGTTTRGLVLHYFAEQGEAFLRGMFAAAMGEDSFSRQDWQRLASAAQGLGMTEPELQAAVLPQAQRYVEHVLADAKADGRVSDDERASLQWLIDLFGLPQPFQQYVCAVVAEVDRFVALREGRLPNVTVPGLALRAGEIAHHSCPATYAQVRQLKDGPRVQRHDGIVTMTDSRLILSSPTKAFDLNYRRVIGLLPFEGGVEIRARGVGGGYYSFGGDARIANAICEAAVKKANQVLVQRVEGGPTRHIPRDIRQRVWQTYGGRCAECGATQYLEFDHIVPAARGGSNAEANVQLLCRGCNLKKSDAI